MDDRGLSLEQKFPQRSFETLVDRMSLDQAREMLVKLHEQMLMKDATYQKMLRSSLFS